ncbi:hypothetical protein [Chryseobacterium joostei]|nr:hypothetical protein [Chryseobacterium joostei]
MKKILLIVFLLLAVGMVYLIQTRIGLEKFYQDVKYEITSRISKSKTPETQEETQVEQDSIPQGGYTLLEKFDNNLEPFPDNETALYTYYKFPFTKEFKEEERNKPMPDKLIVATMKPTEEDATTAFQMNMEGRLSDLVERGLRFRVGNCYENDKTDIYGNKPCVTCNIAVFTPNKADALKTIHVFPEYSYDFYYEENNFPKWKVTDALMNIPFDYKLYEETNDNLKQIGFEIQKSEMFKEE